MKTTKTLMLIALLTITFSAYSQKCKDPYPEGKHLVNTDEAGNNIAMEGYDLTSFFDSKPVLGSATYSSTHQGITYLFATADNKNSFDNNPTKYMPQYGGFCAVAIYFNKAEELQTYDLYDVVDGKLYFNKNKKAKKVWDNKTPAKIIERSDSNWNCIVADLGLDINVSYTEPASIK